MRAEGMKFLQHYAGSTVCAPSRSSLMTGQHTGHTTVRGNSGLSGERVPLNEQDVTVAELLKQAGYTTACIGKWGLGEAGSTGAPTRQGFDHFFGYLNQRNAHFYYPPFLWRNDEKVMLEGNDPDAQVGTYSHDLITGEALDWIDRQKNAPFFLYLAYTIPHAEMVAPDGAMAEFKGRFNPEPSVEKAHYGAQDSPRAAFAAMVTRLDRDVGRLLRLLRDNQIAENTLVFFTSDNGPHAEGGHDYEFFDSNGPFRGIKRDLYEGGIRVPMIAWWPGTVPANSESNHVSAFWDFLPTAAELSGGDAPRNIDGISLVPTLTGRHAEQPKHDYLYWEFYERGGRQALRQGEWKAIRYGVIREANPPTELYHLPTDPGETRNLADTYPEYADRLTRLMREAHIPSKAFRF